MAWLIGVLATVLALSIAPLAPTCSNDGSHFVLSVSLSQGRVALGEYGEIAKPDYAERDGVVYSDRAPGLALALVPFVWLGLDPRLLSAAAFGGTLAVLYGWLRRDGCSAAVACATAAVGATTLLLRYAPVLFAHSLAAFLLVLSGRLITGRTRHGWLLGLALGWAGITEYGLAVLAIAAALVAWRYWPSYYVGLAVPVSAAALYHWVAFGAPWHTGYDFQATFAVSHSIPATFDGPLWAGLKSFVLRGKDSWGSDNEGLLALSPVLALWPLGVLAMWRRMRWHAALLTVVCTGYLLLYSKFVAFAAGVHDSRYYVPFLPLLLVAIGHLLARVGWPALLVAGALAVWDTANLLPHIQRSFGWHGQLALHTPAMRSAHLQLGQVYEKRGEQDRAAAEYELALRLAPYTSSGAHAGLGAVRLAQGHPDQALPLLTAAVGEQPDDGQVLANLGTALLQQERFAEAEMHLQRAVVLLPDSAQAHNNLGVALARQERWDEAAAQFERALAINPHHATATRSLAYVRGQIGRTGGQSQN